MQSVLPVWVSPGVPGGFLIGDRMSRSGRHPRRGVMGNPARRSMHRDRAWLRARRSVASSFASHEGRRRPFETTDSKNPPVPGGRPDRRAPARVDSVRPRGLTWLTSGRWWKRPDPARRAVRGRVGRSSGSRADRSVRPIRITGSGFEHVPRVTVAGVRPCLLGRR
ncbi:hypothetical protein FRUB_04591 [Fimbriiglobus ruber]|uniref:Uncharacterized protein n=1 Tax=Fimbriiglobus ruber TaxID=1908690 RepID=A0A225DRJ3_9BACT|nr:hypothetical protein FRUB_04591 [Fimbriiglobus ruber]